VNNGCANVHVFSFCLCLLIFIRDETFEFATLFFVDFSGLALIFIIDGVSSHIECSVFGLMRY